MSGTVTGSRNIAVNETNTHFYYLLEVTDNKETNMSDGDDHYREKQNKNWMSFSNWAAEFLG